MADLSELQEAYEAALEAYRDDPSGDNYAEYKNASDTFALARAEQKVAEAADPNHPRGTVFASTTLKETE